MPRDHCADLGDGDVVLIAPDGGIMVVYKAGSPYNSILATNRCNSLCVMCPQPPGRDPDDLHENNLQLISLLDPKTTEQLGITGGEPTLLGEDLITLVQTCRQKLPNTLLTLLTNGRRLKDLEFARALVKAGSPNLLIEIPLFADNDTEHDAVMGAKGSFYETLQGLHNLALLGQPVGLRTILHAMTIKRLTQYAAFVYQNLPFVFQVAFMGMETRGLASQNLARLWVDPYDYQDQLAHAVQVSWPGGWCRCPFTTISSVSCPGNCGPLPENPSPTGNSLTRRPATPVPSEKVAAGFSVPAKNTAPFSTPSPELISRRFPVSSVQK